LREKEFGSQESNSNRFSLDKRFEVQQLPVLTVPTRKTVSPDLDQVFPTRAGRDALTQDQNIREAAEYWRAQIRCSS
jgi:hypothetical protein